MTKCSKQIGVTGFVKAITAEIVPKEKYLVVAKRHSLDISQISKDDSKLQFIKTIHLREEEELIDITAMYVGYEMNNWLILALKPNILRFIAFRSIEDHFTVEQFPLKFRGIHYTIQPGSLFADSEFFSVATTQQDLLVFKKNGTGEYGTDVHENFVKALDINNTKTLKFFLKPQIYQLRHLVSMDGDKFEILFWNVLTDGEDFGLTAIHKTASGVYCMGHPKMKIKRYESFMTGTHDGVLPEKVAPFAVSFDHVGSILFSQSGFYYRASPYEFDIIMEKNCKLDEGATIDSGLHVREGCYSHLKIPNKTWDVKIASRYEDPNNKGLISNTLFVENNGEIYMMTLDANTFSSADFSSTVKEWTVRKIEGSLPGLLHLTVLGEGVLYAITETLEAFSFTVENDKIKILQKIGNQRTYWNGKKLTDILPKWKLFDSAQCFHAISTDDSLVFQKNSIGNKMIEHKQSIGSSGTLDIKTIGGKTLVLKKNGLWAEKQHIKPLEISHGVILEGGELATVSEGKLAAKNYEVELFQLDPSFELSVMQALESSTGELYAALGSWDGKAKIGGPGFKEEFTLSSSVTSASIFMIGSIAVFLLGSDSGEVQIYTKGSGTNQLMIGEGSVDFSNVVGNKVIAYNEQSTVQISFNEKGQVVESFYLGIEPPAAIKLDDSGRLITFNEQEKELTITDLEQVTKYLIE